MGSQTIYLHFIMFFFRVSMIILQCSVTTGNINLSYSYSCVKRLWSLLFVNRKALDFIRSFIEIISMMPCCWNVKNLNSFIMFVVITSDSVLSCANVRFTEALIVSSSSPVIVLMACTIVDFIQMKCQHQTGIIQWWLHTDTTNVIQTAGWLPLKLTYRYLHTLVTLSKDKDLVMEHLPTEDSSSEDDAHITQACFVTNIQLELSPIEP